MKLQFLGTGSAFVAFAENFQSNMVLQSNTGKRLLIDCGTDARHSLAAAGLGYCDIDGVYISHFHADHAGGLEWLALSFYFDQQAAKPFLALHPEMVERLWNNVLSGGLQCLEGSLSARLTDYFELLPCDHKFRFIWESVLFELVKTVHVYNGPELAPSYGLFFAVDKTKVFITTDTQFKPERYRTYYNEADLIFHDCETTPHKGCVHAHFNDLTSLDPAIKAKMWLYHYSNASAFDAVGHGFRGFVLKGQTFEL